MMKRNRTQTERLLDLDRRIREGEFPNCSRFAKEWEISTKTAQRDFDFLRDRLGAPVFYDPGKRGYAYSEDTFMLPALQMNEGELLSLLIASRVLQSYHGTPLADKLSQLFEKLSELLPETVSLKPEELFTQFTVTGPPAMPVSVPVWEKIIKALLQKKWIRIEYANAGGIRSHRVFPVHLANLHGDWYVFVQFSGYDNFRQLALSRIQSVRILNARGGVQGKFVPEKELAGTFARFAGQNPLFSVKVLFSSDVAEEVLLRQWHPQQKTKWLKDGRLELSFKAKGEKEVQRWIQSYGSHAVVMSPDWLREQIISENQELLRLLI